MNLVKYIFYFLFSLIFFLPQCGFAKTLKVDDPNKTFSTIGHLQILEDKEGSLSYQNILLSKNTTQFQLFQGKIPNFGYTSSAYWIKLDLLNTTSRNRWLLILPHSGLDYVDVYFQKSWQHRNQKISIRGFKAH